MLSVGREEKEHIIFASKSTSFYYTVQLLNLYKDMLWDKYGIVRAGVRAHHVARYNRLLEPISCTPNQALC